MSGVSAKLSKKIHRSLYKKLQELVPETQSKFTELKKKHSNTVIEEVKAGQVMGGMRGMTGLVYETSKLDPYEGIRYRGKTLREIMKYCPKQVKGGAPLPEGVLWLLLTGEIPTEKEVKNIQEEMQERSYIPHSTIESIQAYPKYMHPMTQLSMGILACQPMSVFAKQYREGIPKSSYWEVAYDDCLDVIAKVPKIAALVFNNVYRDDADICEAEASKLDYGAGYARMMGFTDESIYELMRLYIVLHMDHEGGNVSAHSCRLTGSALADPYLSFSSCMNGLAGPLHGLANQECLRWLLDFTEKYGDDWNEQDVVDFVHHTVNSGKVVPGYGHAVLRKTDPRFEIQLEFAEKNFGDDNLIKLVRKCYDIIPEEMPKIKKSVANPFPNVDAASGSLLMHFGIDQFDYYTVLFGVSRAFGVMSALLWDRALNLPIERPGSVTVESLQEKCDKLA